MPVLFKNIRRFLLKQNKVKSYLLYAIGEIVLVVIGILIALQVNNWNEKRKMAENELYYLQRLEDDFRTNKLIADQNIQFCEIQRNNADLVLKSFQEELNPQESAKWFYAVNQLWFLPHNKYVANTWDELNNTGNINLISNKQILRKIGDFYTRVSSAEQLEEEWTNFHLEYRKKTNALINWKLRKQIVSQNIDTVGESNYKAFPNVDLYIDKLKSIEGVEGLIGDIEINREVGKKEVHLPMKGDVMGILSQLYEEIEARSNKQLK